MSARTALTAASSFCGTAMCSSLAPGVLSPETGPPSMRTLHAANFAQEGEEVLRCDGFPFGHLQRRRPFAGRLLIHLRQSRADQHERQGRSWRDGKLGFASKLALGVLTHSVLL